MTGVASDCKDYIVTFLVSIHYSFPNSISPNVLKHPKNSKTTTTSLNFPFPFAMYIFLNIERTNGNKYNATTKKCSPNSAVLAVSLAPF